MKIQFIRALKRKSLFCSQGFTLAVLDGAGSNRKTRFQLVSYPTNVFVSGSLHDYVLYIMKTNDTFCYPNGGSKIEFRANLTYRLANYSMSIWSKLYAIAFRIDYLLKKLKIWRAQSKVGSSKWVNNGVFFRNISLSQSGFARTTQTYKHPKSKPFLPLDLWISPEKTKIETADLECISLQRK